MRIATNGRRRTRGAGFGLVEIMIVVCVVILLCCLAVPVTTKLQVHSVAELTRLIDYRAGADAPESPEI